MPRIHLLALAALVCSLAEAQSLRTVRIASNISVPTHACSPPGDTERLFVTSAPVGIRLIKNGALLPQPFLSLQGLVFQGVGSMAFHPDYATNGRFFVVLFETGFVNRIVEYRVSATNPDVADPNSAVTILGPVSQVSETHCWNHLQFGPDGMLYVSTGDGVLDEPVNMPSQDLGSLAGKILRLDVDAPPPYVPADNPFVGIPGAREEIWAYGLRNPWRFHIDFATDTLYVADVGDIGVVAREELNVLPMALARGANFGWKCIEGTLCRNFQGCPPGCPPLPNWVVPVHEFDHTAGRCAIIGGSTYHGPIAGLDGLYFFAEWCTGSIRTVEWDGQSIVAITDRTAELAPGGGLRIDLPNAFGTDAQGNLYILDNGGGEVYRVEEVCGAISLVCQPSMNSVGLGARIATFGSTSLSRNDFGLVVDDAPPLASGLFFCGVTTTLRPFGNGALCVDSPLYRILPTLATDSAGRADVLLDVAPASLLRTLGAVAPGLGTTFQFWYRDPAAGGAGFNSSSAVRVEFCL